MFNKAEEDEDGVWEAVGAVIVVYLFEVDDEGEVCGC
jgi:hypothetical protein